MNKMRNYSKVYLDINDRLDPIVSSMSHMRENNPSIFNVYYIPRDAKMDGL